MKTIQTRAPLGRMAALSSRALVPAFVLIVFSGVHSLAQPATGRQQTQPPHLRKQGTATQLVVDEKPFLVLGGELGNSSSSSIEYMRPIWRKLVALNLWTEA